MGASEMSPPKKLYFDLVVARARSKRGWTPRNLAAALQKATSPDSATRVVFTDDKENPTISVTVEVPTLNPIGEVFAAARHALFDTEFERLQQVTVI